MDCDRRSDMSLLRRGIISSGKLDEGGGPTEFSTNSADFNGTTQYLSYPDGVCSGESIISIELFFKLDTLAPHNQFFYYETGTSGVASRIQVYVGVNDRLYVGIRDTDGGTFHFSQTSSPVTTGVEYHVIFISNSNTNTQSVILNGVAQSFSMSPGAFGNIHSGAYFDDSAIAAESGGAASWLNGQVSFLGVYNTDKTSVASELYNGGKATCYGSRTASMKAGEVFYIESANWSGHTGSEIIDQVGAKTVTNNNSTPFTGTGPTVVC